MLLHWGGPRQALWPRRGQEALSRKELRHRWGRGRHGHNHTQVHQAVGGWGAGALWRAAGWRTQAQMGEDRRAGSGAWSSSAGAAGLPQGGKAAGRMMARP